MSYVVEGVIVQISEVQQVTDKFKKREFVLELKDSFNGQDFFSYAKMQLLQNKVGIIDGYVVGDAVKAHFNVKGSKWERDGKVNYITNLDCWKLEDGVQNYQAYQPNAASYAPPAAGSSANVNSGYNPSPESVDDLPF